MTFDEYLERLRAGEDLDRSDAGAFLVPILEDESLPETRIADALTVLTEKGPTIEEICGFIDVMRARMTKLPYDGRAIDTCGTGGDKSGTFNISTASAILLAAGGVPVAKHGNRAATSKCGSADVLEALGAPVDLPPEAAAKRLEQDGFVFLFAPLYHPALKRLGGVRKQLGFPTVFNLLGPLLNPAGVRRQVIGTFSLKNAKLIAGVMARMDYEHAIVLTSDDGLDEAGLAAPVTLLEVKGPDVTESKINAADFDLETAAVADLAGGDAEENARIITDALQPAEGTLNPHQRVIVLNAAIGFYAAGKRPSIAEGVRLAEETLRSGKGAAKLKELTA